MVPCGSYPAMTITTNRIFVADEARETFPDKYVSGQYCDRVSMASTFHRLLNEVCFTRGARVARRCRLIAAPVNKFIRSYKGLYPPLSATDKLNDFSGGLA